LDQPLHKGFIIANDTPNDWRSPQNTNLWQGVNGVNNPCPNGYRLPTEVEANAERLSWYDNSAQGAIYSPLGFTLTGWRIGSSGIVSDVGMVGVFWCSTINGTNSRALTTIYGNANVGSSNRAHGFAVRCIKH
jgi:hypothetical protein